MFNKEQKTKAVKPTATEEGTKLLFIGKGWQTKKGIIIKIDSNKLQEEVKKNPDLFINKWNELKFYLGEKKEKGKAGESFYLTLMENKDE